LWLNIFTSFSVMPLRIVSLLGVTLAILGMLLVIVLWATAFHESQSSPGWLSIISAILLFGGLQSLILGLIGEYGGRILLTVSGKPQSFVRTVEALECMDVLSASHR
jgi:undecaprenyl-phosphate 4-deoxy-4-formamido-L-arabinose transferase